MRSVTANCIARLFFLTIGAVILTGCATQSLSLSKSEVEQIRIVGIDFEWKPTANVSWLAAEEAFVEEVEASPELSRKFKPKLRKASFSDSGQVNDDPTRANMIHSPEGRAFMRARAQELIRKGLEQQVLPKFTGTHQVRLKVKMFGFVVPSTAQRVLIGGNPILGAQTSLVDANTGKVLGKLDRTASTPTANGLMAIVTSVSASPLAKRLVGGYVAQVLAWLKQTRA